MSLELPPRFPNEKGFFRIASFTFLDLLAREIWKRFSPRVSNFSRHKTGYKPQQNTSTRLAGVKMFTNTPFSFTYLTSSRSPLNISSKYRGSTCSAPDINRGAAASGRKNSSRPRYFLRGAVKPSVNTHTRGMNLRGRECLEYCVAAV